MTKISNQEKYVPDLRISELDSVIGTDYDDNDKTVNFRVRELAEFINRFNGNSGLDFVFFFRQDESLNEPNSGYFYSELNVSNPVNITKLYFSKTTSSGFDVSKVFNFLQSNSSDYLLKIANTSDPNKFFYLNISSIVNNTAYYTINVSLKGTPIGILLENNTTHTIFIEQKSSSVTIERTSELINDGSDNTSVYVEADELGTVATSNDYNDLDNKPTIPTPLTLHSELTLDDGTNPHNTTKSDVGLGNVDNTSDLNKPISNATQTALDSKQDISTLTTSSITTTYDIDWNIGTHYLTMTANTTLTESNLPSGATTKVISIYITGNFALTLPTNWSTNIIGGYDGTVLNQIVVEYISSGVYWVTITQPD